MCQGEACSDNLCLHLEDNRVATGAFNMTYLSGLTNVKSLNTELLVDGKKHCFIILLVLEPGSSIAPSMRRFLFQMKRILSL